MEPQQKAPKGGRQALDAYWLTELKRDGLSRHLPERREPPPELALAVDEFNQGKYWQCHETLEGLWLAEAYPVRLFYHALLKAAVGLLHIERHNRRGATSKLGDAMDTLEPFLPRFMGVDTGKLAGALNARLDLLTGIEQVDWKSSDRMPRVTISFNP